MSKAVMLSIRPKWFEKICGGEKTIEVRKTRPKLETPFKCYIYCTQASVRYQTICGCHVLNSDELYRHPEQGIKHGDSIELMLCENYTKDNKCPKCGVMVKRDFTFFDVGDWNFCPNCGEPMEGGAENAAD